MPAWKNQLTKFLIVGSISTAINYLVFSLSTYQFKIHYALSSIIGYFCGFAFGYLFNRNWSFSSHKSTSNKQRELIVYLLVNLFSLACSLLLLRALVDDLNWPAWFSNILAIGLSTITNFTGLKFVVFKSRSHDPK